MIAADAPVRATPRLRLRLHDAGIMSIDWLSGETIAAGCSNGWLAVWRVGAALRAATPPALLRPIVYIPMHSGPLRSIAVVRVPPVTDEGLADLDAEPTRICVTGYGGRTAFVDLREPTLVQIASSDRMVGTSIAWSSHLGSAVFADPDNAARAMSLRSNNVFATTRFLGCRGAINVRSLALNEADVAGPGDERIPPLRRGRVRRRHRPVGQSAPQAPSSPGAGE